MSDSTTRRRRILYALAALIFVLAGSYELSRRPAELRWKDQPASYWIGRFSFLDRSDGQSSAEEFLYAAGPEVIPHLVWGLHLKDGWLHDRWLDLYFKRPILRRYFSLPCRRSSYRTSCAKGLGLLGPAAAAAVPDLLRALDDRHREVRSAAALALVRVGAPKSQFIPRLGADLALKDPNERLGCIVALVRSMPDPTAAGTLRTLLQDPDPNIRSWAVMGLGRDESEPELTAQQLGEALKDGQLSVRMNAARELGRLAPRSPNSVAYLTSALEVEKEGVVQSRLIDSLRGLGPKGASAIPALARITDRTNEVSMFALVALASIDPENAEYRRRLIDCLDQPGGWWAAMELGRQGGKAQEAIPHLQRMEQSADRWSARAIAALAAWRIDSSQPTPFPRLAEELLLETRMPYEVLQYLGEMGLAARPAVPALRQLKATRGSIHYERLNDALGKIAPEYLQDPWRPN